MLIENLDVSRTENLPYLTNMKFHFSLNQYNYQRWIIKELSY